MHASARRRRGRTYVQSLCRGGVRVETDHRPGQKLTEVHVPAAYVAADEVGVLPFEIRRPGDALRKNTVPETGGETFYLRLDPLGHVEGRAVWDVAVGPGCVLARGLPSFVAQPSPHPADSDRRLVEAEAEVVA